jgi:hypothetical protein
VEHGWVAPTAARPLGPLSVSAAGRGMGKDDANCGSAGRSGWEASCGWRRTVGRRGVRGAVGGGGGVEEWREKEREQMAVTVGWGG